MNEMTPEILRTIENKTWVEGCPDEPRYCIVCHTLYCEPHAKWCPLFGIDDFASAWKADRKLIGQYEAGASKLQDHIEKLEVHIEALEKAICDELCECGSWEDATKDEHDNDCPYSRFVAVLAAEEKKP